ncbi:MAG: hypothetical protein NVS2B3_04260 [Vulcanimicrobiaceae bacterium]
MSDLHESVRVRCPFASAGAHVAAYLDRFAGEAGGAHFNLRLAPEVLEALGLSDGDTGVNVTTRSLDTGSSPIARYRIRWTPERAAPHTLFFGELAVERSAEPAGDSFALRLEGRYEMPREAPPRDTEGIYAKRVARATAVALLERIDTFVTAAAARERTRGSSNGTTHGYEP